MTRKFRLLEPVTAIIDQTTKEVASGVITQIKQTTDGFYYSVQVGDDTDAKLYEVPEADINSANR